MVVISLPGILTFPLDQRSDLPGMRWIDASDRAAGSLQSLGTLQSLLYMSLLETSIALNMLVINHGWPWIDTWEFKIGGKHPEVHHPSERSFGCWWYDISLEAPRRYGGFLAKLSCFGWESMFFALELKCSWWMEPGNFPSVVPILPNPRRRRCTLTFARWTPSCVAVWNWVLWRMRRQGRLGWVVYWGGGGGSEFWRFLMWLKWPSRGRPFFFFDTTHVLPKMTMSGILRTCKDIFLEVSTWCRHLQVTWPPTFGSGEGHKVDFQQFAMLLGHGYLRKSTW